MLLKYISSYAIQHTHLGLDLIVPSFFQRDDAGIVSGHVIIEVVRATATASATSTVLIGCCGSYAMLWYIQEVSSRCCQVCDAERKGDRVKGASKTLGSVEGVVVYSM
jgi:hypothetical protein